jgi:purine-binding chemotaxis protein CheW
MSSMTSLSIKDFVAANTMPGGIQVPRQFISFRIDGEEYAIDIMAVREIKGWTATTKLPNQQPHMLGVLNLRGAIVPIFDLRRRFGKDLTEATPMHVVIIASVQDRTVGLLVDAVSDILTVDAGEIRPVPETERGDGEDFLSGIVAIGGGMVVLLDLDCLFASTPLDHLGQAAA